jgi:hypothetical protein
MVGWRGRLLAAGVIAVVVVNIAAFSWLYAAAMLAFEFTAFVLLGLAAIVVRSACCGPSDVP